VTNAGKFFLLQEVLRDGFGGKMCGKFVGDEKLSSRERENLSKVVSSWRKSAGSEHQRKKRLD
jgi:hypothetical protein